MNNGGVNMAFVFKILDSDDKKFLEKFDLRNPFNHRHKASLYSWVKDEERNIYFFSLGGQGVALEYPEIFNLIIDNKKIEVFAYNSIEKNSMGQLIVKWTIFDIYVPRNLDCGAEEISNIISNAFTEYGYGSKKQIVINVIINQICEPKYRS